MRDLTESLFDGDMEDRFAKLAGLCVATYIEVLALQDYLDERGIAIDKDRLSDIRREIKLGGAGLRDRGQGELASLVRLAQEFADDSDLGSHGLPH